MLPTNDHQEQHWQELGTIHWYVLSVLNASPSIGFPIDQIERSLPPRLQVGRQSLKDRLNYLAQYGLCEIGRPPDYWCKITAAGSEVIDGIRQSEAVIVQPKFP